MAVPFQLTAKPSPPDMFHELRTIRSAPAPVEFCSPSRAFRWHSRRNRRKFGFAATVQEEFAAAVPTVELTPPSPPPSAPDRE
jgi:hypothetical protein